MSASVRIDAGGEHVTLRDPSTAQIVHAMQRLGGCSAPEPSTWADAYDERDRLAAELAGPETVVLDADDWPTDVPITDLAAAADTPRPEAKLLGGLVYHHRWSWLYGPPGHGKTWLALQAAIDARRLGCRVLWIDAEDSDVTCAQRLRTLGADDLLTSPAFRWLDHAEWAERSLGVRRALGQWADAGEAGGFVVIDAATSSGAGHTLESFETWDAETLGPIPTDCGVLVVDHTPKRLADDTGSRVSGPIGSVAKGARATGALLFVSGRPWTDTFEGTSAVYLDKDRAAGLGALGRRGERIGRITGTPDAATGTLRLTVELGPFERTDTTGPDAADVLAAVVDVVGAQPGINRNRIRQNLTGRGFGQKVIDGALRTLRDDGTLMVQSGPRNAALHYLADAPDNVVRLPLGVEDD